MYLSYTVPYTKLKLGLRTRVCVCSLIAREWVYQFETSFACLVLGSGRDYRKVETSRNSLGISTGEGGLSSSKHDRRTAPRQKSFVSKSGW
jgi:hypothetical protein